MGSQSPSCLFFAQISEENWKIFVSFFYAKHICHIKSLGIIISLLARVGGWFTD